MAEEKSRRLPGWVTWELVLSKEIRESDSELKEEEGIGEGTSGAKAQSQNHRMVLRCDRGKFEEGFGVHWLPWMSS